MDGMTMVFKAGDAEMLKGLKTGERRRIASRIAPRRRTVPWPHRSDDVKKESA